LPDLQQDQTIHRTERKDVAKVAKKTRTHKFEDYRYPDWR